MIQKKLFRFFREEKEKTDEFQRSGGSTHFATPAIERFQARPFDQRHLVSRML